MPYCVPTRCPFASLSACYGIVTHWVTGADSRPLASATTLTVRQFSPLTAVALVAVSVGLTVIAGIIPAARASRQDPVEALRSE